MEEVVGAFFTTRARMVGAADKIEAVKPNHGDGAFTRIVRQQGNGRATFMTRDYLDFMVENVISSFTSLNPVSQNTVLQYIANRLIKTSSSLKRLVEPSSDIFSKILNQNSSKESDKSDHHDHAGALYRDNRANRTVAVLICSSYPDVKIRHAMFRAAYWSTRRYYSHIVAMVATKHDEEMIKSSGMTFFEVNTFDIPYIGDGSKHNALLCWYALKTVIRRLKLKGSYKDDSNADAAFGGMFKKAGSFSRTDEVANLNPLSASSSPHLRTDMAQKDASRGVAWEMFNYIFLARADMILHQRSTSDLFDVLDLHEAGSFLLSPHRMLTMPLVKDFPKAMQSNWPLNSPQRLPDVTVVEEHLTDPDLDDRGGWGGGSCCDDGRYYFARCGEHWWWYNCPKWGLQNYTTWLKFGDAGLTMPTGTLHRGRCNYSTDKILCPLPAKCKARTPERKVMPAHFASPEQRAGAIRLNVSIDMVDSKGNKRAFSRFTKCNEIPIVSINEAINETTVDEKVDPGLSKIYDKLYPYRVTQRKAREAIIKEQQRLNETIRNATRTLNRYSSGVYVPSYEFTMEDDTHAMLITRDRLLGAADAVSTRQASQGDAAFNSILRQHGRGRINFMTRDFLDFMVEDLSTTFASLKAGSSAEKQVVKKLHKTITSMRSIVQDTDLEDIDERQNATIVVLICPSTPDPDLRHLIFEASYWSVRRYYSHIAAMVPTRSDAKIIKASHDMEFTEIITLGIPYTQDLDLHDSMLMWHSLRNSLDRFSAGQEDSTSQQPQELKQQQQLQQEQQQELPMSLLPVMKATERDLGWSEFYYLYIARGDTILHQRSSSALYDVLDSNNLGNFLLLPHRMLTIPLAQELKGAPGIIQSGARGIPDLPPVTVVKVSLNHSTELYSTGSCCDAGRHIFSPCPSGSGRHDKKWYQCKDWGLRNHTVWFKMGSSGLPMPATSIHQAKCSFSAERRACALPEGCKARVPLTVWPKQHGSGYGDRGQDTPQKEDSASSRGIDGGGGGGSSSSDRGGLASSSLSVQGGVGGGSSGSSGSSDSSGHNNHQRFRKCGEMQLVDINEAYLDLSNPAVQAELARRGFPIRVELPKSTIIDKN